MLDAVIVDKSLWIPGDEFYDFINPDELKLLPFVYLVANEVLEADKIERYIPPEGYANGTTQLLIKGNFHPKVQQMDYNSFGSIPIFTTSNKAKQIAIKEQGVNPHNALLVLCMAGLNITVPNLTVDIAKSEEIQAIKHKLEEERENYIHALAEMSSEACDRILEQDYDETIKWALAQSEYKIRPKAEKLEREIKKLNHTLLKRVRYNFFKDSIPVLGQTLAEKGFNDFLGKLLSETLKLLCGSLLRNIEYRKYPEVVYGMNLHGKIKKSNRH